MANTNAIDYFTITSIGNATDFGDMTQQSRYPSCTDNGTNERGISFGGADAHSDVIEYITINSAGNATDFGDLTNSINGAGAGSNSTNERGVVGGGSSQSNVIQYVTINSAGNATDFGDLTIGREGLFSAVSNGTGERGIFCSGNPIGAAINRMDYITINTTGNATVFGSMRQPSVWTGGYSDCGT